MAQQQNDKESFSEYEKEHSAESTAVPPALGYCATFSRPGTVMLHHIMLLCYAVLCQMMMLDDDDDDDDDGGGGDDDEDDDCYLT